MTMSPASALRAENEPDPLDELRGARTIRETCQALRVTRATIANWREAGKLRVIKAGGRVLIPLSAIRAILIEN